MYDEECNVLIKKVIIQDVSYIHQVNVSNLTPQPKTNNIIQPLETNSIQHSVFVLFR